MASRAEETSARWLRLREAARYSAIGEKRLVALADAGTVRGFQDPDSGRHDWVFDRVSIDEYRLGQAADSSGGKVNLAVQEILAVRRGRKR